MPSQPADQATDHSQSQAAQREASTARPRIAPEELASWLRERVPELGREWAEEIRARGLGQGAEVDGVVTRFVAQLTSFVPWLISPYGGQLESLWSRASELFGAMAAKRGLAAGEVIEEFQILREILIRMLHRDPPAGGRKLLSLREMLRLNRIVDLGVTHASVGHTDSMFFQFFEAPDVAPVVSPQEAAREAEAQLELILEELHETVGQAPPELLGHATEH